MKNSGLVLRAIFGWLAVLVIALGAGWWNAERQRDVLQADLIEAAQHCAVSFATDDVASLGGTRSDLSSSAYRSVKLRLQRLRAVSPRVRFVYLFRSAEEPGQVVFLADSEPEESTDLSLPGDPYAEALQSPGLQSILRNFRPATEGPIRDEWGEWVTAYALVGDRPLPGSPSTVLGIDMDASHWRRELLAHGSAGFAIALVLFGVPLALIQYLLRERAHTREIRRLSAAVQQSRSAVLITTPSRKIEYANDGALAGSGYSREELIGQSLEMLLVEDLVPTERAELTARLDAGDAWHGELRIRRRSGEIFPARVAFSPVRGSSGALVHLIALVDDISDLKKSEQELRIARDRAESADRAKGEFLAVMSHELRTPLNGIIGFAGLLRETPLTTEQAEFATTIQKSGEALLALTNELLDYSRIDAGRMQLELQPCSPRQVVEEAVEVLSTRATDKQLEILVSIHSGVPAVVLGDPGRLRQVLVNLIGNAIKFTPAGEVEVELNLTTLPAGDFPRVQLDFFVRDSGIGISAENQDRLFRPFSQVDSSSTRKHGGAGLGLAISRSLVQLMKGDIEVSSEAGEGAVFHFHIPVRIIEEGVPLAGLPPRRIAVVAANPRARRHYIRILERWGVKAHGFETLARLPAGRSHDAVIIDVSGRDVGSWLTLLRTRTVVDDMPLIGLASPQGSAGVRDDLRDCFQVMLRKPLRDSMLHTALARLLKP